MDLSNYSFVLPESLIGQQAIEPRDSCKLMVINRESQSITHHVFSQIENILDSNYVLVLNDTSVFPARLFGHKDTGGKSEVLLLKQTSSFSFTALIRGKIREKQTLSFSDKLNGLIDRKMEDGQVEIIFDHSGLELINLIDEIGKTPLPPYIHSKAKESDLRKQYQTVYAKEKGSAAAPTAGLHFTESLLNRLEKRGVEIEKVTLHVGLGTFKPVTEEQIKSQTLHSESFYIRDDVATRLNEAKSKGKKIIAVGTTTCRVLESQTDSQGLLQSGGGETNIFIQPGYKFKFIDGLVTNFHLPNTSLLMLVSTLISKPNSPIEFTNFSSSLIGKAYDEAIKKKYRFFSFGDAMIIL